MTPDQIRLVRESFAKVVPIHTAAAAIFYDRLFQVAPEIRSLFPTDLTPQGAKLMAALGMVAAGLERLESIIPQVHELGRRHADYGVRDAHYDLIGQTLIWTLDKVLGAAFTPETREAWIEAYGMLAEAMIAAPKLRAA
jgi:nitric oxide dioxygenase